MDRHRLNSFDSGSNQWQAPVNMVRLITEILLWPDIKYGLITVYFI